jgi:hypothetical protein
MTTIVYPVPLDTTEIWQEFKPAVERFAKTYSEFPPDSPCELVLVLNTGDTRLIPADLERIFEDLHYQTIIYNGQGCDVGSWQHAAKCLPDCFMVCCTTRTYFHRRGWLARLVEARGLFGPGFYTTSVSREGGKLHGCCRCFGIDSALFREYPHLITSREQGTFYEIGKQMRTGEVNACGAFCDWVGYERGLESMAVYWDGDWDILDNSEAHCLTSPNIFRRGDQSNMLVWDKHTLAYEEADETEKRRLEAMCFGEK